MNNKIANVSYETDSVVNFVMASLLQVIHNEQIYSWSLTSFDDNQRIDLTRFTSEVADRLKDKFAHYAAIYLNDDCNIQLEKATSFEELIELYEDDPDSIESNATFLYATFLYEEKDIVYRLDIICDC